MLFKPSVILTVMASALLAAPSFGQLEFNELFRNGDPDFRVQISTDRVHHIYEEGDELSLEIKTSAPAYLHLFNVRPDGSLHRLIPTDPSHPVHLSEAGTIRFPDQNSPIEATSPFGAEQIWCLATDKPVDLNLQQPTGPLKEFVDVLKKEGRPTDCTTNSSILKAFVVQQEIKHDISWSGQAINVITVPKVIHQDGTGDSLSRRIFIGVSPDCREASLDAMAQLQEAYGRWGFRSRILTGSSATRDAVEDQLKELAEVTSPGDVICLHFMASCVTVPGGDADSAVSQVREDKNVTGLLMFGSKPDQPRTMLTEERLAMRLSFLPDRHILVSADLQTVHGQSPDTNRDSTGRGNSFDVSEHLVDNPLKTFVSVIRLGPPMSIDRQPVITGTGRPSGEPPSNCQVLECLSQMLRHDGCRNLLEVVNAVLNSSHLRDAPPKWTATAEAQAGLARVRLTDDRRVTATERQAP